MSADQLVTYAKDVISACNEFENASIKLKELGLLSQYREYELDLFIKRNKHYYRGRIMKMIFHFIRVPDSDIPVEGATPAECMQKAYDERMKQVAPVKITGEVVE